MISAIVRAFSVDRENSRLAAWARRQRADRRYLNELGGSQDLIQVGESQRPHRKLMLGPDVERLATRGEDRQIPTRGKGVGDHRRGDQHVLEVVEDQQESLALHEVDDGLPQRHLGSAAP